MKRILKKVLFGMGIVFCVFMSYVLWEFYKFTSSNHTLSIGLSSTIDEAKKRGVFLWEYEPDTLYVCDSIPLIIKNAFAQKECRWKNYESDSIVILNSSYVLCSLDSCSVLEGNGVYFLKGAEYMTIDCERGFEDELPPDSLPVYVVERKHHYNEKGELIIERDPQGYLLRGDTIQILYLHKKK